MAENCPLGQTIGAVVLDDVHHVQPPPHDVAELSQTYGSRVAVAGDPDVDEVAVGQGGTCGHGGHAPVHRVEAVRLIQKVVGGFRRATNARKLGDAVGRQAEVEARLHYGSADGVVAATGAKGRYGPFVVAPGQAQIIDRQTRVAGLGLGAVAHVASSLSVRRRPSACAPAAGATLGRWRQP